MPASNTRECFSEFIGQKVVAVLFDSMPLSDRGLATGSKVLIFEDGRGLRVAANGTYNIEAKEEVTRAIAAAEKRLRRTEKELAGVLAISRDEGGEDG